MLVAQMIGHSTPSILQTYAKAIDDYRRDAIQKLDTYRQARGEFPAKNQPTPLPSVLQ